MNGDPMQFEEPILQIRRQIEEASAADGDPARLTELQEKLTKVANDIYANLTPWQKTLVARHPQRPYTLDFIASLFDEWIQIHGDRNFADDAAIVAGFARFRGPACAIVGHQKGRNTKEKIIRNFGQPRPEGFRKALRIMKLAEKFKVPIFSFVDTQGAYPGVGAEERGQAEAIAVNLREMAGLEVPIIISVIGEGGSGGALGLGVGDRVFMLEHAVYSVISPEGCAAANAHHGPGSEEVRDHRRDRPRARRRRARRRQQGRRAPRTLPREGVDRAAKAQAERTPRGEVQEVPEDGSVREGVNRGSRAQGRGADGCLLTAR